MRVEWQFQDDGILGRYTVLFGGYACTNIVEQSASSISRPDGRT
jgi:hypothetical protein